MIKRNDLLTVAFILDEILKKYKLIKYYVKGNELYYWIDGIKVGFIIKFKEDDSDEL